MTAISSAFTEQTTEQTHTDDQLWTAISGTTLSNTNFTINRKYLIFVAAQISGDNTGGEFGIRLLHGSTVFTGSDMRVEPALTTNRYTYSWFTVWNPTTAGEALEDLTMEFATLGSSNHEVRADQITMFSMEISEGLTENTDWFWNENTTSTALTTTFTSTNNATTTFTPINNNDDWLILTSATLGGDVSASFESRMTHGSDTLMGWKQEGEDTDDRMVHTTCKVKQLANSEQTITQQSRNADASDGDRFYSSVFMLRLNAFDTHSSSFTEAETAVNTPRNNWGEVQTTSITPGSTIDVWCLSSCITDGQAEYSARLQIDGADQPGTQTSDIYPILSGWDATDELGFFMQTRESLDNSAHPVDLDMSSGTTSVFAEDVLCMAITMGATAGIPAAEGRIFQTMVNQSVII